MRRKPGGLPTSQRVQSHFVRRTTLRQKSSKGPLKRTRRRYGLTQMIWLAGFLIATSTTVVVCSRFPRSSATYSSEVIHWSTIFLALSAMSSTCEKATWKGLPWVPVACRTFQGHNRALMKDAKISSLVKKLYTLDPEYTPERLDQVPSSWPRFNSSG